MCHPSAQPLSEGRVPAAVRNAAVKSGCMYSYGRMLSRFLDRSPEERVLGRMVILGFICQGPATPFPTAAAPARAPGRRGWGPLRPTSSPAAAVFVMLANRTGVRWRLTVGSTCVALMSSDAERLFVCLLSIRASPERCQFRCSARFLIGGFVLLSGGLLAPCTGDVVRKYLLPLRWPPLCLVEGFFGCAGAF